MDGSEPGGEFEVDSGFGEHFTEEYQAKSVIGNHTDDKSGSNRDVIDLSWSADEGNQVLVENDSEDYVHNIVDDQCHNQ